ncbi:sialidase family protein [Cohnella fermenti]|uniref:Laminin G domain-containing protein n=1 Tax=Cohnella fermenti TaxID=2565925 RepID=A0A4S4BPF1_9BACL|nr:sialidase family protein [Cohnella fermenti]THF76242.1 hypothetical protein E6C55_19640 [Cohnella fermenti]
MNRAVACILFVCLITIHAWPASAADYRIDPIRIYENDGSNHFWWSHTRCASIPDQGDNGGPAILCTASQDPDDNLTDVFYDIAYTISTDLGDSWSPYAVIPQFDWKTLPNGYDGMLIDPVPVYHALSGKVLLLGMAQSYDANFAKKQTYPAYAVYDPSTGTWSDDWQLFGWPPVYGHAGSSYPYIEESTGDVLWPIHSISGSGALQVVTASFDGTSLVYKSASGTVSNTGSNGNRSGIEASLAKFGGQYFMTSRDDTNNRLTKSADGLVWQPAVDLLWEDGTSVAGSMNTQMHWLTRPDGLYLVYTRQDEVNSDLFRYRAPLWMARIDPATLRLQKDTERNVMPNTTDRAQLGNFGTLDISPELSIVTSNEWKSLLPNSTIVSRIWWNRSLLGSWPLDETSGSVASDASGAGHNGAIVGAATDSEGRFGTAFGFSSSGDRVDLGSPADGSFDFGSSQDFTVSAWIRTSHSGSIQYIVNKGDTNAAYWLRLEADGKLRFLLDYGSTYDAVQSSFSLADGAWHHVLAAADRDADLRLYVDGALAAQKTGLLGGNISNSLPLTIGFPSASTMKGSIDEVKLYNYALDEREALGLSGLVGRWSFDEPATAAGIVAANDVSDYEYGMLLNGASRSAAGHAGGAVQFTGGNQFVKLGDPDSGSYDFGVDQDFSLSAWFKTSTVGSAKYILNKGDTNASYALRIESNGTLRFWLDYGSTADIAQSTASYTDGQWHHAVAVADRDAGLRLYVDGVLTAENTSLLGGSISSKLSLTVGHNSSSTMNGFIDDVRLYRYALTAQEAR